VRLLRRRGGPVALHRPRQSRRRPPAPQPRRQRALLGPWRGRIAEERKRMSVSLAPRGPARPTRRRYHPHLT
jgi:hypothetical protein